MSVPIPEEGQLLDTTSEILNNKATSIINVSLVVLMSRLAVPLIFQTYSRIEIRTIHKCRIVDITLIITKLHVASFLYRTHDDMTYYEKGRLTASDV